MIREVFTHEDAIALAFPGSPTIASTDAESAGAVTARDATAPRARTRPLEPPANATPTSTERVDPPPQTGTAEAHGRAGTIRVDDF